jgi:protein-tyrosine phosphatase
MFQQGLHHQFTQDMMLAMYANMPIGNASYRELMKLLSSPEKNLPLVQHCAGGRDRTGVGSMLILLTLGVPYEAVMDDYLLSNITLVSYHQELFDIASQYVSGEELRAFKNAMHLQERYLDASIDSIFREYGTFERYLELEFGIDDDIRTRIQDYCLE